jgi:hypothetical protein
MLISKLFARRREYRRLLAQAKRMPKTTAGQARLSHLYGFLTKQQLVTVLAACSPRPDLGSWG